MQFVTQALQSHGTLCTELEQRDKNSCSVIYFRAMPNKTSMIWDMFNFSFLKRTKHRHALKYVLRVADLMWQFCYIFGYSIQSEHSMQHEISRYQEAFYSQGLTLIPAWINNYIHYKMWGEIIDRFLVQSLKSVNEYYLSMLGLMLIPCYWSGPHASHFVGRHLIFKSGNLSLIARKRVTFNYASCLLMVLHC